MNSPQTSSHAIEPLMPQSSNFGAPYYVNPIYGIYPNQLAFGHPSNSAAQHATGAPLYGYNVYPYPLIQTMMPVDYMVDEKSDDGMSTDSNSGIMAQQWSMEYQQGQVDGPVHQPPVEEYLPNQYVHPKDQEQQLPPNEFIANQSPEFIQPMPSIDKRMPNEGEFVYNPPNVDHHSPHLNSPNPNVYKQQQQQSQVINVTNQ